MYIMVAETSLENIENVDTNVDLSEGVELMDLSGVMALAPKIPSKSPIICQVGYRNLGLNRNTPIHAIVVFGWVRNRRFEPLAFRVGGRVYLYGSIAGHRTPDRGHTSAVNIPTYACPVDKDVTFDVLVMLRSPVHLGGGVLHYVNWGRGNRVIGLRWPDVAHWSRSVYAFGVFRRVMTVTRRPEPPRRRLEVRGARVYQG